MAGVSVLVPAERAASLEGRLINFEEIRAGSRQYAAWTGTSQAIEGIDFFDVGVYNRQT